MFDLYYWKNCIKIKNWKRNLKKLKVFSLSLLCFLKSYIVWKLQLRVIKILRKGHDVLFYIKREHPFVSLASFIKRKLKNCKTTAAYYVVMFGWCVSFVFPSFFFRDDNARLGNALLTRCVCDPELQYYC